MEGFGSWSILTTDFLFVLYMALAGVTFASILHLVNGKWRSQVRYFAVAFYALFPLAFVLLIILLIAGGHTFPWLGAEHTEAGGEHHLNGWHNYAFLVIREVLGLLIVTGMFGLFVKYQYLAADDNASTAIKRKFRNIALLIPFFYVLYGSMVAWDFEMTMVPGWHSSSDAPYQVVSMFHCFLAVFAIVLYLLYSRGKMTTPVKPFVFNYLAQMMLAFTILWTYFYFTQYLIMWYGRLPHEMGRFDAMMLHEFAPLWWTYLALKFIIPFVLFATWTPNRHNPRVIVTIAMGIVVGTWIERYTWIAGSVDPTYYHMPMFSIFDSVATVIIFGAAYGSIKWTLNRYGLIKT